MKASMGIAALAGLLLAAPASGQVCDGISTVNATSLVSVEVDNGYTGNPLLVTAPPGDDRLFIVEQIGRIWVKPPDTALGVHYLFLDLSPVVNAAGNEQGLLGLTFSDDFATSREFYVSYTGPGGTGVTTLRTYMQSALSPNKADPNPVNTFFTTNQPWPNHNGGGITVGPDGFVYFGLGDGGNFNDVGAGHAICGNGQSMSTLLGKMIRIDPTGGSPNPPECGSGSYTIPDGNPFADGPGGNCDEIWALGLRNPWRFAFDPTNDDLYIADVGQDCYEEVNWVKGDSVGGENYGWRVMEGQHCFDPNDGFNCSAAGVACIGSPSCNDPSLTSPVLELPQAGPLFTCSITGGYPYRGCRIGNYDGHYFWGDYCDGQIRSFLIDEGVATQQNDWTSTIDPGGALTFGLTSFGQDGFGELYTVDRDGQIRKIVPPIGDFEVSGNGVADVDLFSPSKVADWTWEDLDAATIHPLDYYSVYRAPLGQTYECLHSTNDTTWVGDPTNPLVAEVLTYLVTATNTTTGEETSGGGSRVLGTPCAAP